jgi:hypothetical protein
VVRLSQNCKDASDAFMAHWRQDHSTLANKAVNECCSYVGENRTAGPQIACVKQSVKQSLRRISLGTAYKMPGSLLHTFENTDAE